MDTSFIAISYFKTLEVTLAKKIGELSKGAELVKYIDKEKKVNVVLDYQRNPIEVGDKMYYDQTIGRYNGFIRNFGDYEKYEEHFDPLHPDYRGKRDKLWENKRTTSQMYIAINVAIKAFWQFNKWRRCATSSMR